MATLVSQDTSGVFVAGPDEVEVPHRRTRSFRKFRLPDAPDGRRRWRIGGGVGPVHYRMDPFDEGETFKEIDLDILPTPGEPWDAACETNGFQVRFWQARTIGAKTVRYIAQFRRADCTFSMAPLGLWWVNAAGARQLISRTVGGIAPVIDNAAHTVTWAGAFGTGLDFRYNLSPDQFVKQVIVQTKASLPAPTIGTTGLRLVVAMAVHWTGANPANGFAAGNQPTDLSGDDEFNGTADEALTDPAMFAHTRADLREAFWCQTPRAWDSAAERHEVAVQWRLQRRGATVLALFGVTAAALNAAQTVYPVYMDTAIGEERVTASADDATQYSATWPGSGGTRSITSSVQYLGDDGGNYYTCGFRFQTVPIPKDATIDSAVMSQRASTSGGTSAAFSVACEAVDSSAVFDATSHCSTDAILAGVTTAVDWAPGAWTNNVWYDTPELIVPVGEIVTRAGWAANQNLTILFWKKATGKVSTWRGSNSYDFGAEYCAKFNCTYTEAATGRALFLGPNLWTGGKALLRTSDL